MTGKSSSGTTLPAMKTLSQPRIGTIRELSRPPRNAPSGNPQIMIPVAVARSRFERIRNDTACVQTRF